MIEEFEVVWSGTMSRNGDGLILVGPRETKTSGKKEPNRIYNKTGKHTAKAKEADRERKRTQQN